MIYRGIRDIEAPIQLNAALAVLGVEVLTGIVLAYLGMPALAQPLHLLLGVLSFGLVLYGWMRIRFTTSS